MVRVVCDEDDADAVVARCEDVAQHDTGRLHAERRRRLVQDQDARTEVDGARNRHRLPLASGERPDRLIGIADVDPHLQHVLARLPLGEGDVESAQRPHALRRLRAEEEVAPDRHQRHDREVLVDGRDAVGARLARGVEGQLAALDEQSPLVRRVRAGEDLDQRRLAGAVVAQDAEHLPRVDVRGDVLEGDDVPEVLADVIDLQQVRRGTHSFAFAAR